MATPLLSVIVPSRNRRSLAEQAVRSALSAGPISVEVILSDNNSSDSTPDLAALFPEIRYVRHDRLYPMADHWNRAVSLARGKYVKLLCDDDWLAPGALEREVSALTLNPTLVAAASAVEEVSFDGRQSRGRKQITSCPTVLGGPRLWWTMLKEENLPGPPSAVTFRRSAFIGFPETYTYAADWAAWIQLADHGPMVFLPEVGCYFRLHEANLTQRHVREGTDFIEVMALRRECLRRLPLLWKLLGALTYVAIWKYRCLRRLLKLAREKRLKEFPAFFWRALSEHRPALPRSAGSGPA